MVVFVRFEEYVVCVLLFSWAGWSWPVAGLCGCPFSCLPCGLLSLYLLLFCFCCVLPFPLLGFARFCFPPHCWPVPLWGRHLCCCAALLSVASPYSSFFCLLVSSAPWHGRCKVFARFSVLAFSACSLSCFACLPFDSRGSCYSCGVLCVTLACSFF